MVSNRPLQGKKPQAKKQVSPLRQRMIGDMELAGLTGGTQQNYIRAVMMLQDHYTIRPDSTTAGPAYPPRPLAPRDNVGYFSHIVIGRQ